LTHLEWMTNVRGNRYESGIDKSEIGIGSH